VLAPLPKLRRGLPARTGLTNVFSDSFVQPSFLGSAP
jgi:hypothetical protein